MDLSVSGWSDAQIDAVVRLMRECGWAAWYRPYLLWLILIVVTFILQSQRDADEL